MSDRLRTPRTARPAAAASILGLLAAAALAVGSVAAAAPPGTGGVGAAAVPASIQVGTTPTVLGTVLTGPTGMTLYTLSSDPNGGSVCSGQCLVFWPPLLVAAGGPVTVSPGVSGTFATFVRTDDGTTQVTDDGRALYHFKNDTAPGQTNGEGIQGAGGVWHVALAATVAPPPVATPAVSEPAQVPTSTNPAAGSTPPPTSTEGASPDSRPIAPLWIFALVFASSLAAIVARRRPRRVPTR